MTNSASVANAPQPQLLPEKVIMGENTLKGSIMPVLPKNPPEADFDALEAILRAESDSEDRIIANLSFCESGNRNDIKILDVNNKYSYGRFMFQMDTFLRYGFKYGYFLIGQEPEDYENIIYDGILQEKMARRILEEPEGWRNWTNCLFRVYASK